jgi:hypothetical protein
MDAGGTACPLSPHTPGPTLLASATVSGDFSPCLCNWLTYQFQQRSAPTLVQLRRAGDERFTPCVPMPQSSADTSTLFTVTHLDGRGVFFVILH